MTNMSRFLFHLFTLETVQKSLQRRGVPPSLPPSLCLMPAPSCVRKWMWRRTGDPEGEIQLQIKPVLQMFPLLLPISDKWGRGTPGGNWLLPAAAAAAAAFLSGRHLLFLPLQKEEQKTIKSEEEGNTAAPSFRSLSKQGGGGETPLLTRNRRRWAGPRTLKD